jgi:hypothetical protein
MNNDKYHIYYIGEIIGDNYDKVKSEFLKVCDINIDINKLFSREKIYLIYNVDQSEAADYIEKFEKIGMICHIEIANPEIIISQNENYQRLPLKTRIMKITQSETVQFKCFLIFLLLLFCFGNLSVIMIGILLTAIAMCYILHKQQYGYDGIIPANFWTINRIIGLVFVFIYIYFSIKITDFLPNFSRGMSYTSDLPHSRQISSGFGYIILLPIIGIISMLYNDLIYTPENEMIREGWNIVSIFVGLYFIFLSIIVFSAFL